MSDAAFFTFTGLRGLAYSAPPAAFKVTKASTMEFPALLVLGLGVSYAVLQYPVGSVNPLHTHPRGTELLYVLKGSLKVGLVDPKNVLYVQNIKKGDMFVFPKVLVHFQLNTDSKRSAVALSAFSSANAGTVSLPGTLFASGIENSVLAMTFKTDVKTTIQKLKAGLVSKGRELCYLLLSVLGMLLGFENICHNDQMFCIIYCLMFNMDKYFGNKKNCSFPRGNFNSVHK